MNWNWIQLHVPSISEAGRGGGTELPLISVSYEVVNRYIPITYGIQVAVHQNRNVIFMVSYLLPNFATAELLSTFQWPFLNCWRINECTIKKMFFFVGFFFNGPCQDRLSLVKRHKWFSEPALFTNTLWDAAQPCDSVNICWNAAVGNLIPL